MAWGETRPGARQGELASRGHSKETCPSPVFRFCLSLQFWKKSGTGCWNVPGRQKGPGLQFSLSSAVDPAGVPSGRRRIPQELCLLLPWDAVLKEARVISGGSVRPSVVPFPSTLPAGPSFLETRSVNIFTPVQYLNLGLAQGDLRVPRSGGGSGGVLGKRLLRREPLPEKPSCGRWRWLNCSVGLSLFT